MDAIKKQYLKSVMLIVFTDPGHPDESWAAFPRTNVIVRDADEEYDSILESWYFDITYSTSGPGLEMRNPQVAGQATPVTHSKPNIRKSVKVSSLLPLYAVLTGLQMSGHTKIAHHVFWIK